MLCSTGLRSITASSPPEGLNHWRGLICGNRLGQLIQTGLVAGLSQVSAGGALGVPGASLVGQLGWVILVTIIYNESDTMHGKNLYHAVEYS